jgi:hypothetical protein
MTLVELLVASALMLVVMAAIYGVWSGLDRTFRFTNDDMIAQQEAREAMGEIVEFTRTARVPAVPPTEFRSTEISYAGPFRLEMWTDIDRDSGHTPELVRFRVDPNPLDDVSRKAFTLLRETGNSATGDFDGGTIQVRMVNKNVSNDAANQLFSYADLAGNTLPFDAVDGDGNPVLSDPTKIREVQITLRVDVFADEAPATNVLSSVVQPRNMRRY